MCLLEGFWLFKLAVNQRSSGLNRVLSSIFEWLRSAKHVKFTEEHVICKETHGLLNYFPIF